ncbi:hypothetical protein ACLQ9J_11360 [Bordetella hinzii]|uniref:hypothetical protein n=1 Tax=Bordetella hinzii TaxID=103855 RepID=UPI0039FBAA9E
MFANQMEPAAEHQITDTGKYTVVVVNNFTEPGDMMDVTLSQVNYRYKVERCR